MKLTVENIINLGKRGFPKNVIGVLFAFAIVGSLILASAGVNQKSGNGEYLGYVWNGYPSEGTNTIPNVDIPVIPTIPTCNDRLGVSGYNITIDGKPITKPLFGVDETTALQFVISTFINGDERHRGMNQNFPQMEGRISCTSETDFWDKYFTYCNQYGVNLVRIGAADAWGSRLQYEAWADHQSAYYNSLNIMADQAQKHQVYIMFVMAGTQDYPCYNYRGTGDVFDVNSQAYRNYIEYCKDTMYELGPKCGIGIYDLFNEPDCDYANYKFWQGDKMKFHKWTCQVAIDTKSAATHPRTMGTAGAGTFFGFSQEDFNLATGNVPFELCDRHFYATAEDAYLFSMPEEWSREVNKPLVWSEIGLNNRYPLDRWYFAESQIELAGGQAIVEMDLRTTPGYPNQ